MVLSPWCFPAASVAGSVASYLFVWEKTMKTLVAFLSCIVLAVSAQASGKIYYTGLNNQPLPDQITMMPGDTHWFELHVEATYSEAFDYSQIRLFEYNDGAVAITKADPSNPHYFQFTESDVITHKIMGGANIGSSRLWGNIVIGSFELTAIAEGMATLGAYQYGYPTGSQVGIAGQPYEAIIYPTDITTLAISIVPEPATLCLLVMGGVGFIRRQF